MLRFVPMGVESRFYGDVVVVAPIYSILYTIKVPTERVSTRRKVYVRTNMKIKEELVDFLSPERVLRTYELLPYGLLITVRSFG